MNSKLDKSIQAMLEKLETNENEGKQLIGELRKELR